MAQILLIDLKKNPEVADVVADLEVGDGLKVLTTIKSKDEQTLELRLTEVAEIGAPDESEEDPEEEAAESPEEEATEDEEAAP